MRKGKTAKMAALLVACVLVCCSVIGGTIAWLIDTPAAVVNTFTYGDINITLAESPTPDGDENPNTNTYKMIPGRVITKDPVVTALAGSEKMWLFVELKKSEGFDDFMTFEIADGWTFLKEGVYYREVEAVDTDTKYGVLKDNEVKVSEDVTKDKLYQLTAYPTLTVTAYAIQHEGFDTAEKAWEKVEEAANTPANP